MYSVLTDAQKHQFEERMQLDFSFGLKGLSRFRVNAFTQRGDVAAVMRAIPYEVSTFENLKLPRVVAEICQKPRGLVLVTGPTGSGKSTTLAAMIDKINCERRGHIITVEDPIEFVHSHKKCLVNQRELNSDVHSFADALKAALREDPDVVLIGEMRDLETISSALRIAETGHLTFGTVHTNSAAQTVNRLIDVFPAHQQPQVRAQLSLVLEGILCQALLPRLRGKGRALAMEVLVPTAAIRNLIRDDKVHQIYSSMQTGRGKSGMQTFNDSLSHLYFTKQVSAETAIQTSPVPEELEDMLERGPAARPARKRAVARRPVREIAGASGKSGLDRRDAGRCRSAPRASAEREPPRCSQRVSHRASGDPSRRTRSRGPEDGRSAAGHPE